MEWTTGFDQLLNYFTLLQVLFFLTQCGEERGQKDDHNAKRMENIMNSRKREKEEEINHQNFITLDCLTGEQRKKIRPFVFSMFAYYLLGEFKMLYLTPSYVCAVNLNLYYFIVLLQSYTCRQVSCTDKPRSVPHSIVQRIILIANDYNSWLKVHFETGIWKGLCLAPITTHSLCIPYHQGYFLTHLRK